MRPSLLSSLVLAVPLAASLGCGAAETSVLTGGKKDGGSVAGTDGGTPSTCLPMPELCDGMDNDCDGVADDGFDADGDGYSVCLEDCNDNDPTSHPFAVEVLDSKDNDCDGKVDNKISGVDSDGDGYQYGTPTNGLAPDCNDEEPFVGPAAVEVAGDNTDNNCNGQVDEPVGTCDANISLSTTAPGDFARAAEICSGVSSSSFGGVSSPDPRAVRERFGNTWVPKAGSRFFLLSTGRAKDGNEGNSPQNGTDFYSNGASPSDGSAVNDLSVLTLTLKVPANAQSFSIDFAFFSAEFPEFVGTQFNDRFVAVLTSQALPAKFNTSACAVSSESGCRAGNISFDGNGKEVSVNNNYFVVCQGQAPCNSALFGQLAGTGFEAQDPNGRPKGGGSGWLTTKAPVKPGETIKLQFAVYDAADGIYDSAVLVDNFRWEAQSVQGPTTTPIN